MKIVIKKLDPQFSEECIVYVKTDDNVNVEAVLGLDIQDRRPTVLPLGVLSISFSTVRRRHTRNEAR